MEKLREKVYELTAKQNEGIFKMSDQDLIEYVILPQIAKPTGPDTRGKCISDDFMELMADFGQELYKKNAFIGQVLFKIAMQRISHGAVTHNLRTILTQLPAPYRKYSVYFDEPAPMSLGCFHFIQKQGAFVLQLESCHEHMEDILFGIIDHLDKNGHEQGGLMLSSAVDGATLYQQAWIILHKCISFEKLWQHCATPDGWQQRKVFFQENWKRIDHKEFADRIGLNGHFKSFRAKKLVFA